MNEKQWDILLKVINGETVSPLPSGFIIDSPWLPGWYGINILDYYTNDELWLNANLKALDTFPDTMFLPGFWSEYGMCSEPASFGAKCSFPINDFPHAYEVIENIEDIDKLKVPDPSKHGLTPFLLNRLKLNRKNIEKAGYNIKFSVSRGPLNIASFLMGMTNFMIQLLEAPEKILKLMDIITTYLEEWHALQRKTFPEIDGMLLLDDIIGFIGEDDFKTFGLPYFKRLFDTDMSVKFLHNDADYKSSIKFLPEMGVNLFNMAFDSSLNELKELTNNNVTMLGNIPPRDVLAKGSPEEVKKSAEDLLSSLHDTKHIIFSCGGGMPPDVSSENIHEFVNTVKNYK